MANKGQMRTFEKNGASTSLFSVELVDEHARPRAGLLLMRGPAPLAGLHACSAHRRTVSHGASSRTRVIHDASGAPADTPLWEAFSATNHYGLFTLHASRADRRSRRRTGQSHLGPGMRGGGRACPARRAEPAGPRAAGDGHRGHAVARARGALL